LNISIFWTLSFQIIFFCRAKNTRSIGISFVPNSIFSIFVASCGGIALNSKDKGKRREREAARLFADIFGKPFARGQQNKGGENSPDIIGFDYIHPEIKGDQSVANISLYRAMQQAIDDSGNKLPMLAIKRDRAEWLLVIRAENVVQFAEMVLREKK
jgi:hypothetical protein